MIIMFGLIDRILDIIGISAWWTFKLVRWWYRKTT